MSDLQSKIQIGGYVPGAIGKIIEMNGIYYSKTWGFNANFEAQIADGLAEFIQNFDADRDRLLIAQVEDQIIGSIAVKGDRLTVGQARLRWFILDAAYQGKGIGKLLLKEALTFCQQSSVQTVYLWTFPELKAACHLYQQMGFRVVEEQLDCEWGTPVLHQKFELSLQRGD